MTTQLVPPRSTPMWRSLLPAGITVAACVGLLCAAGLLPTQDSKPTDRPTAPELDGGTAWLNTARPLKLKDLKGKFVLLDFWTLCCINCIHTLPDLAKLEKKYEKELVVIGVHSPKFDNEKNTESIRKAILRYEIAHPVVNDAERKIWDTYGVDAWPTLVLIDPEGKYIGYASGEGNYQVIDRVLTKLIKEFKEKKLLDDKPLRFDTAAFRESTPTPLFFPGKVLADGPGKRLFIADSTHHRIVITGLDGSKIAVIGNGEPGFVDGPFEKARFDDPQGLALQGDTLYVADRKNHSLRAVDLKTQTVRTISGTGTQDREGRGLFGGADAKGLGLNSPWDLLLIGDNLFIAMAGHHQIWVLDTKTNKIRAYAGNGRENIKDGPLGEANLAQPSGLTTDGKYIYVADCEVSAIRRIPLDEKESVSTIVGKSLFTFGDQDGVGDEVRLQHALAVAAYEGKIIVADTYNSKLKLLDPKDRSCKTFLAGTEQEPLFNEPAGLSIVGDTLYVADTNAHRIRVVNLKTKEVQTLELKGVEPPSLSKK